MWELRKSSTRAILFIALLILNICWQGNARHYLIENSGKTKLKESKIENFNYETEYHQCYILVQETRRIGGQCVKIRDNFQGCVAGSLMDPFHQDCL